MVPEEVVTSLGFSFPAFSTLASVPPGIATTLEERLPALNTLSLLPTGFAIKQGTVGVR